MDHKLSGLVGRQAHCRGWLGAAAVAICLAGAVPAQAAQHVYVTGSNVVNQYSVGAAGKLTPLTPATVPVERYAGDVVVSPDAKSVYVISNDSESFTSTVSQYNIDAQGRLSPKSPPTVDAGLYAEGLATSPDGRSLYVVAAYSEDQSGVLESGVLEYDIDAQGRLSPKTPATVSSNGGPTDVAVSPDGRSVYVTTGNTADASQSYGHVSQYDVDAQGRLSPKSPPMAPPFVVDTDIGVSPNGRYAFVTYGHGGGLLNTYAIDSKGRLASGVDGCCGGTFYPHDPVVSPNGKNLYANGATDMPGSGNNGLHQEDVGPAGELSAKDPPWIPPGAGALVVSSDGRSLYGLSSGIVRFDIGQDGELSYKGPPTAATGDYLAGIAASPDTASVRVSARTLMVTAASGARDNLAINHPSASTLRVTDSPSFPYTGAPIRAGSGCTSSGPYTANCHGEIARVQVTTGDQADRVVNSTGVQSSLYGEAGSDVLLGGSDQDILYGGPDPDTIKGMNGNDQLFARDLTSDTTINCDGGIGTPGHADKADLDKLPKDPNSVALGCETKTRH